MQVAIRVQNYSVKLFVKNYTIKLFAYRNNFDSFWATSPNTESTTCGFQQWITYIVVY